MKAKLIGIGLLLALVVGAIFYKKAQAEAVPKFQGEEITVSGTIGSGKIGFLEDSVIRAQLRDRFGITIKYTKEGSMDIARSDASGLDFLWPSSQSAIELFRQSHPNSKTKIEVIFNSPLVLYSWDLVTDAMEAKSLVGKEDGVYYVKDFPGLANLVVSGQKWKEMGVAGLYGKVGITTTDPASSSSGLLFVGLVANILQGEVVDESTVEKIIPPLRKFYKSLGYMEKSSGDLFQQYLNTGVGAKPLIAGYESQMVEFALQDTTAWKSMNTKVRIIYPQPTLWVTHPLIALTPKGERLLAALRDPEVQKLAWSRHGFRSGVSGIVADPKELPIQGIPGQILQVVQLPNSQVMSRLLASLSAP